MTAGCAVVLVQDGMTSLHVAAMCGHVDVVVALLEGKANVAAMEKVKDQSRSLELGNARPVPLFLTV